MEAFFTEDLFSLSYTVAKTVLGIGYICRAPAKKADEKYVV